MCLLPVLNAPIIEHNVELLRREGIKDIVVVYSEQAAAKDLEFLKQKNGDSNYIRLCKETKPRGTAGALSHVASMVEDQPLLVISSTLYIEDIDLQGLVSFHNSKGAVATVGVKRASRRLSDIESVRVSREGLLEEIRIIHHSMDRRSPWVFAGIYLFAPAVFGFVDGRRYLDIKEQLLPQLQAASLPVYAYEVQGYCRDVSDVEDYFGLHRDLLESDSRAICFTNKKELGDRVWVGDDTLISPVAYLRGPIVLGNKCRIADRAQIIGPTVIGDGCEIAEDAVVRESIFWRDVSLASRAGSEYCVVGEGSRIGEGEQLRNLVVVDNLSVGDLNFMAREHKLVGAGGANLSRLLFASVNKRIFDFTKRVMDVTIALALLIVLFPLYSLIALAIKIDSDRRAPILFVQRRCGKNGKTFSMLKFRTMISSAEKMQAQLLRQKDTDGPMFKMAFDPRITRLGRMLRKTSLDEFPQLINVLKGEMSLVGPRPLIMEEMKFSPSWRDVRLRVKPGITGLWQVQGRSEASFHDWIRYDVEYVMNQSLWLDLKILLKTVKVVFEKVGAY
jgi:lipopolysaccharide/colanic/teichoic acid biosynthesis glycosyltransferase/dTDP-glucose pyrophosphorylase